MQPRKNAATHTIGTSTGTYTCTVIIGGCGGKTGATGTMNAVLTGMVDECAATVVVHRQWQVGTTKNELKLLHMANLMTVQEGVGVCRWVVYEWVCSVLL